MCVCVCVQDLVVWITLGALRIPHSEDVPTVQTAGSRMSFVLQPFNYFDTDPSEHAPDAVHVSASPQHPGKLDYRRHGDQHQLNARHTDCVPLLVRQSAAADTHVGRVIVVTVMTAVTLIN